MIPRERVLRAIAHKEPDRVPVAINLTPQVAETLSKKFNIPFEIKDTGMLANRFSFNEVLVKLGNDVVFVGATAPKNFTPKEFPDGSFMNEWRIRCKWVSYYVEMVGHPLKDIETTQQLDEYFDKYGFPDPEAKGRFDLAEEEIKKYSKDYAIIGCLETTMFETSWYLVGMDKFLVDLMRKKSYVFELLDRVADYHINIGKKLINLGCDIIWTGDDFGTQRGMLISPELWREVFKPRFRRVFRELKKCNPNVKIAYHSCGSIVPIIPDLIEIGLDILNPLQPYAYGMDRKILKNKYGDKLSFFGGIDEQKILPYGSIKDVKEEVRRAIFDLAPGGGYILAAAHNIQPDTSVENIFSIYEAVKEYGRYPIPKDTGKNQVKRR